MLWFFLYSQITPELNGLSKISGKTSCSFNGATVSRGEAWVRKGDKKELCN